MLKLGQRLRSARTLTVAAGLAVAALYLSQADGEYHFMEGASAEKLLQVRALLGGHGYYEAWRVGTPAEVVRPPGFALLLAGLASLVGEDMLWFKTVNNLFAPVGFFALAALLRRRGAGGTVAALIALAAYLFPFFFSIARYLESEILFCALVFLALLAFEAGARGGYADRRLLAAAAALSAAAVMVRTVALALTAALALAALMDSSALLRRRLGWAAAIVAVWLVVGGGWMVRNQAVASPGDLTYLDKALIGEPVESVYWLALDHRLPLLARARSATAADVALRFHQNLVYFSRQLLAAAAPGAGGLGPLGVLLLAVPVLAVIGIGMVRGWRGRGFLLELFVVIYAALILFYPHQDTRFLLPVFPFLVFSFFQGLTAAAGLYFRDADQLGRFARLAPVALLIPLLAAFGVRDARRMAEPPRPTPEIALAPHFRVTSPNLGAYHSLVLLLWIQEHGRPDDRVLYHSFDPCGLLAQRQCSGIPMARPEALMRYLDDAGITLVVVDDEVESGPAIMARFTPTYLLPTIQAFPERFQTVKELPDSSARVLRVVPAP